ncbi:hypothetical protein Hanom_Chr01g00005201 [Helianthus anomalus]
MKLLFLKLTPQLRLLSLSQNNPHTTSIGGVHHHCHPHPHATSTLDQTKP